MIAAALSKPQVAQTRKLFTLVLLARSLSADVAAAAAAAAGVAGSSSAATGASASTAPVAAPVAQPPYSSLLLGLKKRGFGAGKWNGFGGKPESGESVRAAAIREMHEESGLSLVDTRASLSKRAILLQEFEHDPVLLEVHVYLAKAAHGLTLAA